MARFKSWTPWQVPQAPAGSYDPTIDAQQGAVGRGLADQVYDFNTGQARNLTDYGVGQSQIQQGFDRGTQDLGLQRQAGQTSYDRALADLGLSSNRLTQDYETNTGRVGEDYRTNVAALTRNYGQLADSQRQAGAKAGVLRGGALLQAAAKRATNQGIQQQGIDTGFQRTSQDLKSSLDRGTQDIGTQRSRLGEDWTTQQSALDLAGQRLGQDTAFQRGQLDLSLAPTSADNPYGGRASQDAITGLTRAQREASAFGLDASTQRYTQAAAAGWQPSGAPKNEHGLGAAATRTVQRGGYTYVIDQSGRTLSRRKAS